MESGTLRSAVSAPTPQEASSAIIFDGDDTLWETESLYDHARSEAARVAASVGYDPDLFEALQRSIDARNVQAVGLSAARFPASSVEAFSELARRAGAAPTRASWSASVSPRRPSSRQRHPCSPMRRSFWSPFRGRSGSFS